MDSDCQWEIMGISLVTRLINNKGKLVFPDAQHFVFCELLRLQNETAANEVLESIENYFSSQPFEFRGAQIITGQEEGVYGWITANYLMGNFLEVCGKNCMFYFILLFMNHKFWRRCMLKWSSHWLHITTKSRSQARFCYRARIK